MIVGLGQHHHHHGHHGGGYPFGVPFYGGDWGGYQSAPPVVYEIQQPAPAVNWYYMAGFGVIALLLFLKRK